MFAPNRNICTHGEAVAIGIKIAAKFSYIKGLLSQSEYQLITDTISAAGYPTLGDVIKHCHNTSAEDFRKKLLHFMGNDKKCKEDFINFVFIIGVGEVKIIPTPLTEIEHYIDDLCND
jgi:3-dehydroquinate synthetase